MTLSFFVSGTPIPKGSFRAFNNGGRSIITNNNPKTKDWEMRIAHEAQAAIPKTDWPPCMETAVSVKADFYLPRPASLPKKTINNIKRPDLDKLVRACLDGISGIVIKDDSQVVSLSCTKRYSNSEHEPGVWISVETL